MDWKKFFKPTVWKIIAFVLLAVLGFYSMGSVKPTVSCMCAVEVPCSCQQPFPYGNPVFQAIYYILAWAEMIRPWWLGIILWIAYLWAISSLIVFIVNKIKSKK